MGHKIADEVAALMKKAEEVIEDARRFLERTKLFLKSQPNSVQT